MKISSVAMLLTATALLSAAEAEPAKEVSRLRIIVDSEFNKPYGAQWWINRGVSDKGTKVSIVKDGETGNKCLKLEVPDGKKNVSACSTPDFLYAANGIVEVKAKVKGKGAFEFDFYCYRDDKKYIGIRGIPKIEIDSEGWKEISASCPMSGFPKNTARVRAVLSMRSQGTIYVDDVVYTLVKPKN